MSNTNFQPIFDYIDESVANKLDSLRDELHGLATKKDIQKLQNTLDGFAKSTKEVDEKVKVLESKSEGMEHWIIKAAVETKVPYKP